MDIWKKSLLNNQHYFFSNSNSLGPTGQTHEQLQFWSEPSEILNQVLKYPQKLQLSIYLDTKLLTPPNPDTIQRALLFSFSDFIQPDAEHIRGTECDQKILSKKESKGVVYSPNYPFPYQTNVVCRYFIYGMQDEQNLERVRLTFEKFNVPLSTEPSRYVIDSLHFLIYCVIASIGKYKFSAMKCNF